MKQTSCNKKESLYRKRTVVTKETSCRQAVTDCVALQLIAAAKVYSRNLGMSLIPTRLPTLIRHLYSFHVWLSFHNLPFAHVQSHNIVYRLVSTVLLLNGVEAVAMLGWLPTISIQCRAQWRPPLWDLLLTRWAWYKSLHATWIVFSGAFLHAIITL